IRRALVDHLRRLGEGIGRPSPFYAIVQADGDRLGQLLQDQGEEQVSEVLGRFSRCVPEIAGCYGAVVVYAGGDDVLAMAPAASALRFADRLAKEYRKAHEMRDGATLSAGVLFTDGRTPLGTALQAARSLLDDTAKELNGRDS